MKDMQFYFLTKFEYFIDLILQTWVTAVASNQSGHYIRNEDGNREDMRINIDDESNIDVAFQSFSQVIPPLIYEETID
jgi:hypothetical protein